MQDRPYCIAKQPIRHHRRHGAGKPLWLSRLRHKADKETTFTETSAITVAWRLRGGTYTTAATPRVMTAARTLNARTAWRRRPTGWDGIGWLPHQRQGQDRENRANTPYHNKPTDRWVAVCILISCHANAQCLNAASSQPVHLDASRHTKAKYSNQLAGLSGVTTVGANHRIGKKIRPQALQ